MSNIPGSPAAKALGVALCFFSLVAGTAGSAAADAMATTGALICTTGGKSLACTYDGIAGGDGRLRGRITFKGTANTGPSRRVLLWSVRAATRDVQWKTLVGEYRMKTIGRLVGGEDDKIVLVPAVSPAGALSNVVELRLHPAQA